MKLLVFGATGGTGQALVSQALEQGHQVTAFVRNPAALSARDGLSVIQGELSDAAAIAAAVTGQAAVLCALGNRGGQTGVLPAGVKNIVEAMDAAGVRRLVYVTSFGVGDSLEQMGWFARQVVAGMMLKKTLAEKELEEEAIRASKVDWIIVRPGSLEDGTRTGVYRCVTDSKETVGRPRISRADVADFMLKNLTEAQFVRRAVGLTY
jgi:putative NADH-flavin reductase